MIKTVDYCLPDKQLLDNKTNRSLIWIPDTIYIVIGASNSPSSTLITENVLQDHVTVLKRPSGGQAVVLTPNMIVVSAVFHHSIKQPKAIFQQVNRLIMATIEQSGVYNLKEMGISDIAVSEKKILGAAIYRNKDVILYHAVLNMAEPASTLERYLKHPAKEPDYRAGRSHTEFITSLKEKGCTKSIQQLVGDLSAAFESLFC